MLKIEKLLTGPLDVNTYVLTGESGTECAVIDPANFEAVSDYMASHHLSCTKILLTHGHFDHIMAVARMQKKYGAKVYIHEDDAAALGSDKMNMAAFVGMTVEKCTADVLIHDGDIINVDGNELLVMHTPGHSPGSVCFICEKDKVIFSGDTLFYLSVGRADLYKSDKKALEFSILYKLYALHGDYRVLPGHEEETSLDFERENNPVTALFGND